MRLRLRIQRLLATYAYHLEHFEASANAGHGLLASEAHSALAVALQMAVRQNLLGDDLDALLARFVRLNQTHSFLKGYL